MSQQEADEWANDMDRYIEPAGSYNGDEHIVKEATIGDKHIAVWQRWEEFVAYGENTHSIILIKEYIVATTIGNDSTIEYADDLEDAMEMFAYLTQDLDKVSSE